MIGGILICFIVRTSSCPYSVAYPSANNPPVSGSISWPGSASPCESGSAPAQINREIYFRFALLAVMLQSDIGLFLKTGKPPLIFLEDA